MATADALIVYDVENREICTHTDAFAARSAAVLDIQIDDDLEGREIAEGAEIAQLTWSDGCQEALTVPPGCTGKVVYANRRIAYDRIQEPPAQVLFRLG